MRLRCHPRLVLALLTAAVGASVVAAAFAAAGDLDSTFSGDGKATTHFDRGGAFAGGVALQADGKIVVAGVVGGRDSRFALVRFNPNGTLDTSFGGDGKVFTNLTPGNDAARAVAVQPDGKIITVGRAGKRGGRFALVRYNPNGTLDPTFSGDGKKFTDFTRRSDTAFGVALQSNGKIVAAGGAGIHYDAGRFALARYRTNGRLDTSFGGDGKVETNFTSHTDWAEDVAIQADGKIVAAGGAPLFTFDNRERSALARYNADGTLDPSFSENGKVTTDFAGRGEHASGLAIQADGKIVAAGEAGLAFALARYEVNGTLDSSFSGDGRRKTDFTSDADGAQDVAIQPDGKIVAAGHAGRDSFALARYEADGTNDVTFGVDGTVTTTFGDLVFVFASGVAIQADGKIVAAGDAGLGSWFAVARYLG